MDPKQSIKSVVSEIAKLKNSRSKHAFPELNLSENEHVISVVRRHPIGLFWPMFIGSSLILISFFVLFNYGQILDLLDAKSNSEDTFFAITFIVLFIVMVTLVTYFFYFIYTNNRFYLTNEVVVQHIQSGLFARKEQSISLMSVEDASYTKNGLIQHIFDYGTIKLSTVGDEHTYSFTYAASPEHQIDVLNSAVEAFKNGRPVGVN